MGFIIFWSGFILLFIVVGLLSYLSVPPTHHKDGVIEDWYNSRIEYIGLSVIAIIVSLVGLGTSFN